MPRVIILGASRGIGHELARSFGADGWDVVATARTDADRHTVGALAGVSAVAADITDEASLAELGRTAGTVELVIVNAGVNTRESGLDGIQPSEWTRLMTVNALGPLLAARALHDCMTASASFVVLSSTMGSIGGNAGGGSYSYRMSKAALNMGVQNLALDWPGRAVAALHPGWVKTDMGGPGAQVEIADSVAGMRRVIAALRPGGRARFLDYRGNRLDW